MKEQVKENFNTLLDQLIANIKIENALNISNSLILSKEAFDKTDSNQLLDYLGKLENFQQTEKNKNSTEFIKAKLWWLHINNLLNALPLTALIPGLEESLVSINKAKQSPNSEIDHSLDELSVFTCITFIKNLAKKEQWRQAIGILNNLLNYQDLSNSTYANISKILVILFDEEIEKATEKKEKKSYIDSLEESKKKITQNLKNQKRKKTSTSRTIKSEIKINTKSLNKTESISIKTNNSQTSKSKKVDSPVIKSIIIALIIGGLISHLAHLFLSKEEEEGKITQLSNIKTTKEINENVSNSLEKDRETNVEILEDSDKPENLQEKQKTHSTISEKNDQHLPKENDIYNDNEQIKSEDKETTNFARINERLEKLSQSRNNEEKNISEDLDTQETENLKDPEVDTEALNWNEKNDQKEQVREDIRAFPDEEKKLEKTPYLDPSRINNMNVDVIEDNKGKTPIDPSNQNQAVNTRKMPIINPNSLPTSNNVKSYQVKNFAPPKVYITLKATNLLSRPSYVSELLMTLPANVEVDAIAQMGNWLELKPYKGRRAYVILQDLREK